MNSITDLLDLEDNDVIISNIDVQGQTKVLTLEAPPTAHFCPVCGFRMYSRGVKKRNINHPILQDNYSLVLILKQRRWRCINPDCHYSTNESFKFVNKSRRMSNATEMLIVSAYNRSMKRNADNMSITRCLYQIGKNHPTIIQEYRNSQHDIFREFASLLEKFEDP